jgi:peptidoglycan/LPS O-acetylase OafA/YrhL
VLISFQHNIAPSLTHLPRFAAFSLYWVWVALVAIPFSFAVYLLVEKPGMQLSNRLRSQIEARRKQKPMSASQAQESQLVTMR